MPFDIAGALGQGAQAAAGGIIPDVVGMGMGMLGNVLGQQQQYKQAQKLQGLQISGNEQLMDYSENKQYDLWNKTNYPAQVQQMEAAGLNPALMYAKGGPGGVTGSPMGATSGQQATGGTQAAMQGMGIMNQNALLDSQRRNIDADTKLKETQVPQTEANTGNLQADTLLKKVQTDLSNIQKTIQGATIEEQIRTITAQTDNWEEQAAQAKVLTTVQKATMYTQIDQAKQNLVSTLFEQALTKAQTAQTGQQTSLLQKDNKYYAEQFAAELSRISHQNYADIMNAGANADQADNAKNVTAWNKFLHDVPDAEKLPMEILEKIGQAVLLGKVLTGAGRTQIKGFGTNK